jgi:hypothetical protein
MIFDAGLLKSRGKSPILMAMSDVFDYIDWRGDLTFEASPFNPVDNVIFSQLAYMPFDRIADGCCGGVGVSLKEASLALQKQRKRNKKALEGEFLFPDKDPMLLEKLSKSERFAGTVVKDFVNHIDAAAETQFAACTFAFAHKQAYMAFRGTDKTFAGWKEDMNMAFSDAIPAQKEAAAWLEQAGGSFDGALIVGGHSKGGNLAVYAAASCGKRLQKRVLHIYTNDAPGFSLDFLSGDGYVAIRDRVRSFIPELSIVGILFELDVPQTVVKSSETGIMQHSLYSWQTLGANLLCREDVTKESRFLRQTMREWVDSLDLSERRDFAGAVYELLRSTKTGNFWELGEAGPAAIFRIAQRFGGMDKSAKKAMSDALGRLFTAVKNNIALLH